jgi:hypothetical protein
MSEFYDSISPENEIFYLEKAAAAVTEAEEGTELAVIGVGQNEMAYVAAYLATDVEEMLALPESERDAAVTERFANLGNVTFVEYVLGIICAGEEAGAILRPSQDMTMNEESWYSI